MTKTMDKTHVIERLVAHLTEELASCLDAARRKELEAQLLMYRFLPKRAYTTADEIVPSSLVRLKTGQVETMCFLVPQGGGLILEVDGTPVQVVTPHSPLGDQLLGKKAGDTIRIPMREGFREYQILSNH